MYQLDMICIITITSNEMHIIFKSESLIIIHLIHSDQENSIYQLFDDCIIDEAHRLPDYALNQVTNDLDYSDLKYQLGFIGKMKMKNY